MLVINKTQMSLRQQIEDLAKYKKLLLEDLQLQSSDVQETWVELKKVLKDEANLKEQYQMAFAVGHSFSTLVDQFPTIVQRGN